MVSGGLAKARLPNTRAGTSRSRSALKTISAPTPAGSPSVMASGFTRALCANQLLLLEQVLDPLFLDQEVGRSVAIELETRPVVPLDPAADLFAVVHNDDHRRLGAHLFEVVEIFGVRLLGRRGTRAAMAVAICVAVAARLPEVGDVAEH